MGKNENVQVTALVPSCKTTLRRGGTFHTLDRRQARPGLANQLRCRTGAPPILFSQHSFASIFFISTSRRTGQHANASNANAQQGAAKSDRGGSFLSPVAAHFALCIASFCVCLVLVLGSGSRVSGI
ncbi:hypothetical protein CFAM422_012149 [Trichoderma lentiforme]|uniref:Transmembrane protein n=1 Tax=Trichoderma lentiforme TaxID=1567552 RepID=A0A9P5C6T9_9HYPO|nr:hypothetical protein CFAM422_012149 [Trichoderma lentiforme]